MSNRDSMLVKEGLDIIFEKFGLVKGEQFIAALQRETSFDYTKWREHLWEDMDIDELNQKAVSYSKSLDNGSIDKQ